MLRRLARGVLAYAQELHALALGRQSVQLLAGNPRKAARAPQFVADRAGEYEHIGVAFELVPRFVEAEGVATVKIEGADPVLAAARWRDPVNSFDILVRGGLKEGERGV